MSAPTFEDLAKWINVFDSTLNVARNYDSVEVAITFANPPNLNTALTTDANHTSGPIHGEHLSPTCMSLPDFETCYWALLASQVP